MYQCDVQKKKETCEEILACEDLENVEGVHLLLTRYNTTQKIVWKFCRSSDHATKSTATLYCTLDSECGLFRSSWPVGSRLDILAASIFAMLAAYSGSCVPETALTC